MSIKRIAFTASILVVLMIAFFIYPSMNQPIKADQLNTIGYENMIVLQKATGLTNIYCLNVEKNILVKYFDKDIQKVMAQPGCVTVRVYFGTPKEGKSRLIIVGVDKYGKDMVPGFLAGPAPLCPPLCGG